jgi:hypothetical protein
MNKSSYLLFIVLTPPPSPPLKSKGRSDMVNYQLFTPLLLALREVVGGWVKDIKREGATFETPSL